MVDVNERCLLIVIVFTLYLCRTIVVHGSTGDANIDRNKKQLEELEEQDEHQREKEMSKFYSSSKANEFLTYEKCMQRMKCPPNRREECSEECKEGNTEEEVEEHSELTIEEHRNGLNRAPKPKFETGTTRKKHSSTSKQSTTRKQPSTTTTNDSTVKTDL